MLGFEASLRDFSDWLSFCLHFGLSEHTTGANLHKLQSTFNHRLSETHWCIWYHHLKFSQNGVLMFIIIAEQPLWAS